MKKIFITGISGFVGNHLTRKLLESRDVLISGTYLSENSKKALSDISAKIKLFQLDLMNYEAVYKVVEEVKPDEIYHLAAIAAPSQSFENPGAVFANNITSQINLLEAVRKVKISPKIMVISSGEVYGRVDPKDLPIDENTPLVPTNSYAVSKITQDFMGLQYKMSYGIDIIRVRPFNHIGPGQTDKFATSAFAKKIAEIEKGKRKPTLPASNCACLKIKCKR